MVLMRLIGVLSGVLSGVLLTSPSSLLLLRVEELRDLASFSAAGLAGGGGVVVGLQGDVGVTGAQAAALMAKKRSRRVYSNSTNTPS